MKLLFAGVLAAGLLFSTAACSAPSDHGDSGDSGSSSQTTTSDQSDPADTITPTPTPPPALPDASVAVPSVEAQTLTAAGYKVAIVDASGVPISDATGYTFLSESPLAGTPLALGSQVTLTVAAPPPPPPPAPVAPSHPNGATAQCNDGTFSYSAHRSGTCSHHGGVATWF